ncbi:MAG TPA: alpha/beta fold hydrolase [Gemmatimonadales bacterium]|jgi:dienelactone hydrolase
MATPRLAKLQLKGADGRPLPVDVRTAGSDGKRPAVVICHGFKGFKDWGFFPFLADRLAKAGFMAISFNFSGSGVGEGMVFDQPDRFAHQRPTADLQDLATLSDWALAEGSGWLGLVGHSRGGGLAVLQAARDERVKALVTWAAIDHFLRWPDDEVARWRREGRIEIVNSRTGEVLTLLRDALDDIDANRAQLDVVAAAKYVRVPWLIAHGSADATVPVAVAQQLAADSGSARTELLVEAGGDHGFGAKHPWAGSNPIFDDVLDQTVKLFASAL